MPCRIQIKSSTPGCHHFTLMALELSPSNQKVKSGRLSRGAVKAEIEHEESNSPDRMAFANLMALSAQFSNVLQGSGVDGLNLVADSVARERWSWEGCCCRPFLPGGCLGTDIIVFVDQTLSLSSLGPVFARTFHLPGCSLSGCNLTHDSSENLGGGWPVASASTATTYM
jgi:hypothetical protein